MENEKKFKQHRLYCAGMVYLDEKFNTYYCTDCDFVYENIFNSP